MKQLKTKYINMETEKDNLALWHKVEKTNPKYTKEAKIGGHKVTAIAPQYQIMNVTEQFGPYGSNWGFEDIELDYSLVNTPFKRGKKEGTYPNQKVVGLEEAIMGLVVFKATFYYPGGKFPIINSISLFTNNEMTKLDDNFAKKIETDALTKAISKLGFNADIFMGKFDDVRYVEEMKKEFAEKPIDYKAQLEAAPSLVELGKIWTAIPSELKPQHLTLKDDMKEILEILEQVEILGKIKTVLALEAYIKEFETGKFKDNAKLKALIEKRKLDLGVK